MDRPPVGSAALAAVLSVADPRAVVVPAGVGDWAAHPALVKGAAAGGGLA